MTDLRAQLDALYAEFTGRAFVAPDPLEVLYDYPAVRDREVAGLLAAALAYGQVKSIVASLRRLLPRLGPEPAAFVAAATARELTQVTAGLGYRWTRPEHLAGLLRAQQRVLRDAGSLEAAFGAGLDPEARTVSAALARWTARLRAEAGGVDIGHLLADPARGSTCKRLHLYLRWMVRADAVDPGGWTVVRPAQLLVPVDVHMHRIGRALGFTRRAQPSGRATEEITAAFRRLCPEDPVRYDFALTRLGIRERVTRQGRKALRDRLARAGSVQQASYAGEVVGR